MRKHEALSEMGCKSDGLEILIMPSKLKQYREFKPSFLKEFREMEYRSVHFAETDPDYLDNEKAFEELKNLSAIMEKLEADTLIVHAHNFIKNRKYRKDLLLAAMNGEKVLIENNGFDNEKTARVENLQEILLECPEFNFCLDIAHVKDFADLDLDDFIENDVLRQRLREIHYSYSTIQLKEDPYIEKGFQRYRPYHALFSVLDLAPSEKTLEFICSYPIVVEGIQPPEDKKFDLLKKEIEILRGGTL